MTFNFGDNRASKILAQFVVVASGTPANVYSPPANRRAIITKIIISNEGTNSHDYSLYVDPNGATYDVQSAFDIDDAVAANSRDEWDFPDGLEIDENGSVGFDADTNDEVNIHVLGRELDVEVA